ncbi:2Fe-2S iron-sulfur cluster-binding protein [Sinomonas sp. G460-2]|uniref:2Fe-2S iron-sulfur cluster-binding protein n=1 Tax=Sinomonas sp. G460-2 TaxID=3393464 RepID=UPI0039F0F6D9
MPTSITAVDRDGTQHSLAWEEDQTLMEVLRDNDLPVLASCGGTASCATCHVFLDEAVATRLGERSADELELLEEAEGYRACGSRLACQIEHDDALDGIRVELAPES